jgi:hypothetical protein
MLETCVTFVKVLLSECKKQHDCRVKIPLAVGLMAVTNDPLELGIWNFVWSISIFTYFRVLSDYRRVLD